MVHNLRPERGRGGSWQ